MNETTEQKSGRSDLKIEPAKVVTTGSNAQSQAKPDNKQDSKSLAPSSSAAPLLKLTLA